MSPAVHLVLWAQVLLHFARPAQPASSGGQLWNTADPTFIDECVQTHNSLRSSVDPPASNMYHMKWDEALAKSARAWTRTCQFSHNPLRLSQGKLHPEFFPVGENMWVGSPVTFSPKKTIQHWHSEAVNYTYSTMSCLRMCGHYTQVVWAESYKVGCAAQTCSAVKDSPTTGSVIIFVCNYGKACVLSLPRGNRKGAPPYKEGAACSACQGDECQSNLCSESLSLHSAHLKSYLVTSVKHLVYIL
nr:glioma pathogenesis-related protein 1-like isoform X2 [Paramormyrops kingsleyae]